MTTVLLSLAGWECTQERHAHATKGSHTPAAAPDEKSCPDLERFPDFEELVAAAVGLSWVCKRCPTVFDTTHMPHTHTQQAPSVYPSWQHNRLDQTGRVGWWVEGWSSESDLTCSRTCSARARARGPAVHRPGSGGGRGSLATSREGLGFRV